MVSWITNNIGTIIAVAFIGIIVAVAIKSILKSKKEGKSSCGCNCAHCSMAGTCHKDLKKYTFAVTGMTCEMCEIHINDAIRNAFNVAGVVSNRKKDETVVLANQIDTDKIIKLLSDLGYEARIKNNQS